MCELLELSVGKKSEGNKKEKEENRTKLSGNWSILLTCEA